MKQIELVESAHLKKEIPQFKAGDLVCVYVKIKEEDKVRLQAFEGTVMRIKGSGSKTSFTVRKISYGEGVERTFLLYSPLVERIEVVKKGKTRRAKLYYLRGKIGKQSKIDQELKTP